MPTAAEINHLLTGLRRGDKEAMDEAFPQIYDELRSLAHRQLHRQRPDHGLDTTALVHEAYLKLVDHPHTGLRDRCHFLAVAALAMRHIVVDWARARATAKRGGDQALTSLREDDLAINGRAEEILAIDQALTSLGELDGRLSRLVELRFFAGLTVEETAEVLEVSPRTVKRDWRKARAFLYRALGGEGGK